MRACHQFVGGIFAEGQRAIQNNASEKIPPDKRLTENSLQ